MEKKYFLAYKLIIDLNILVNWLKFSYSVVGVIFVWMSINSDFSSFYVFSFFFITTILLNIPRDILSPLNILFAYYGLWFFLSPLLGSGYSDELLNSYDYRVSIGLVFTNFIICLYGIKFGILIGKSINTNPQFFAIDKDSTFRKILGLYFLSSLMIFMIINSSGGINVWLDNPGDAFLNRAGSGVYVILSHFSSIILSSLVGLYAYKYKSFSMWLIFFVWLLLTSPVHGSKFQISLLFILSLLPWLRERKTFSLTSILLVTSFLMIFLLGMIFRDADITNVDKLFNLFNYFSTLHNLAISVSDFEPGSEFTFWLPFNKFLSPFGLDSGVEYYDMNHYLTDIYYPQAWEIRATEQWPVETDLYLNFYFFAGLPFIFFYMVAIGAIYKRSIVTSSFGISIVSLLMTIFMISHLRGSLYNHTDFYMIPYMVIIFLIFRYYKI
ncbi:MULTISPECIES: O-antigen polymerase [Vibrio]|uniref:O-antigen polymerase n=1 Tax=Vibrio TaxID=662 RepID=UPI0014832F30|nr:MULTISPECIES: O-antigen polymerase [Vibrio]MDQ2164210.1 oligosaccharide repeat unit polymerase [Vibrio anguillarum]NNN95614.1 oligosaccharide repeat unit polymerase [Vibrio sp. B4-6]